MPLIPALGRQRQVDFCESKASLVYTVPEKPPKLQRNLSQKTKQTNKPRDRGREGRRERTHTTLQTHFSTAHTTHNTPHVHPCTPNHTNLTSPTVTSQHSVYIVMDSPCFHPARGSSTPYMVRFPQTSAVPLPGGIQAELFLGKP